MANKEMLINVSEGEECRIALVENGRLEELYMERTSSTSHVGNVYKGRVTNVEPSIQAAFVDFGLGRNGFLHISDLMPSYFGGRNEDVVESVGRKMARRDRPPIQRCLKRGDDIIVQIIKEGIGTKGPTLSTYVSIPGRILVMMPGMAKLGVSRKIEDEEERKRLRTILDGLKPPKECGFIIRTAGVGRSKAEIERDLKYLTRLYESIDKQARSSSGPTELYTEGDLVTRTVRDVMSADVERIVVDNKEVGKKIRDFFKLLAPRTKSKVELYEEPVPLFHKYGIEHEIELMYSRHVPLPSGGSLVIDSTEAVVAIDVNSGKFRDHSDAETTAFKTDMEAADEIPRQLRLRDLGGVIICDFIDLRFERHRRELEKTLHENLKADRAKTKMLRMSQFGIIEMTRQRMRPSLKRSIYSDCPACKGHGLVKTPESMSLDVMRRLAMAAHDQRVVRVELSVSAEVAFYLQNRKRHELAQLEHESGKRVIIKTDPAVALDEFRMDLADARDGAVFIPELGIVPPEQAQANGRGQQGQRGGRDRGRRGGGGGGGQERGGQR
ncbi:MAG TPA: Rne/Rng family ribonuclease, partial [Tepidisphaeraceae bacterium]|nr:Rne/Rng family ribonuclease [Tepidisphaeraceae bacterium]